MKPLKIVMMGTGEFAIPAFRSLYSTPHAVVGLYTQPDRIRVGKELHRNGMKEVALEHGTPVFQPEKINTPEALAELASLQADVFLVAAYGQILSRKLLAIPPLGSFNLHASLLPKYRGAAPIHYAIMNGETETGVSMIEIVPELDAGPVVGVVKTLIGDQETTGELEVRLADLSVPLTTEFLNQLSAGKVERLPQAGDQVTFAPKMPKELALIPWDKSGPQVDCHIRAMQPWPTPYTFIHSSGKPPRRLVIRKIRVLPDQLAGGEPGTIAGITATEILVQTGTSLVSLETIQPEGKKPMSAAEFLRGNKLQSGDWFGAIEERPL